MLNGVLYCAEASFVQGPNSEGMACLSMFCMWFAFTTILSIASYIESAGIVPNLV